MPCIICGHSGDTEVDHVVPKKLGGIHEESNLQPLCRVCNAIKRDKRTNEEVKLWIEEHPKEFAEKHERRAQNRRRRFHIWP